mgnify:CR=1 FL=1
MVKRKTKTPRPRRRKKESPKCLPLRLSHDDLGLTDQEFRVLQCFGLPLIALHMLAWMHCTNLLKNVRDLDFVDFFCGVRSIVNAMVTRGKRAAGYDALQDHRMQNMNTPEGFICAMQWIRRLKRRRRSAAWFATVCSTWIWCCRGSTHRHFGQVEGDEWSFEVREANCMASRTCMLIAMLYSVRAAWGLEQPASSLMSEFRSFRRVRKTAALLKMSWHETDVHMGAYNARTLKPSTLYSNRKFIYSLERDVTPEQRANLDSTGVCTVVYKNGKKQVNGGPKLKETQSYTPEFGNAVASAILDTEVEDGKVAPDVVSAFFDQYDLGEAPEWQDLRLEPVWEFMRKLA